MTAERNRRLPVLPPMRCDDGCGKCCGPVPVTAREFGAIQKYVDRHAIEPVFRPDDPLRCPLFDGTRCTVHPVRPLICKVFGHTYRLDCPFGYNVNVSDRVIAGAILANGPALGLLGDLLTEKR